MRSQLLIHNTFGGRCISKAQVPPWNHSFSSPFILHINEHFSVPCHRFLRLASMAPGNCAFQFLRDWFAPLGSEASGTLCVSLYVPQQQSRKHGSLAGQLILDINLACPCTTCKHLHFILATTALLILEIFVLFLIKV